MTFSTIYYEIVIQSLEQKKPILRSITKLHHRLVVSNDLAEINADLEEVNRLFLSIEPQAESMYNAFNLIFYLCLLNLTFLVQHVFTFIFAGKLNRFRDFPQLIHISDTILFISSLTVVNWFTTELQKDLYSDPFITKIEYHERIMSNIEHNVDFKFQYLFAVQVCCLILRISMML